jgi:hypothetical protein
VTRSTFAWTALLLVIGCRSNNSTVADSPLSSDSHTVDGAGSGSDACTSYTTTTIATMRQGTHTGCYEFDNVVTIGTTPSTKSPELFVQDAAGGDFSAMMTKCSSTSTSHPCSVAATVVALPDGHSVTVKGTYIKTAATTFEEFFIDSVTDNGAATAPAPATATLAQIERGGTATNLRFQHVTVAIGANDTLNMYDWTPVEFTDTSATACPYQFGFGMLPKSATGTATPACSSGTAQPAGQATPSANEVLFGTDFYKTFEVSSDCRCAKTFVDMVPSATSTLGGTIGGLLVFDVPFGGSVGYYYLDPKVMTDAPITNLVAGM